MPLPNPEPGLVIPYDYLWRREKTRGQDSGRKTRPAVIVLRVDNHKGGGTTVWVAPVTHTPPLSSNDAVEIPRAVKSALKLDAARSWIVCTEINEFLWPGFDVRPIPGRAGDFVYGFLPPGLFRSVRDRLISNAAKAKIARVKRD